MLSYIYLLFLLNLFFIYANADEAAAICAFVTSTNINSKRNDWNCDNTANRCSWPGITCQVDNKINMIDLAELGISGKKHI